ncbi:glycosyltransferase [Thioclava litoralis]|uniref:Glycosyltransferase n=1 Tax=Thioclava litoralis TaxID=3076557 RepID=A0ABZ1E1U8_9RHOB|nr:glycosyltransferase [Thioclava sp. FTW29]
MGRATTVLGNVDLAVDGQIVGWVKFEDSSVPLSVDVLVDGVPVGMSILANLSRKDVAEAGHGDGCFGFECVWASAPEKRGSSVVSIIRSSDHLELISSQIVREFVEPVFEKTSDIANVEVSHSLPVPMPIPANWKGRVERVENGVVRGWVVNLEDVAKISSVEVLIDGVFFCHATNNCPRQDLFKAGMSAGKGGIELKLPLNRLEVGAHILAIKLPSGETVSKEFHVKDDARKRSCVPSLSELIRPEDVAVIVPVYNAFDDVKVCIERLANYSPPELEIVFINDCSPDARISGLLETATVNRNMHVLHNHTNQGFTRTINRGIDAIGSKHAIFLNSDARVTPGWLDGILRAASSRPKVATVTPMSDRAGAFSAPNIGNENDLPVGISEIEFARAFRRRSLAIYPRVPTGNGFCMFVNRECMDEIGKLDADAFPRGYGEENEFCMRAGRAGWTNLVDDCTYVFHDRNKSFGSEKTGLITAGRAVVDERYPEYSQAIKIFSSGADLQLARFRARQAYRDCDYYPNLQDRILFVVATQSGGTPQTNLDLMQNLSDGFDSWLLRCSGKELFLSRLCNGSLELVEHCVLEEAIEPISHTSAEYDYIVSSWLQKYDFSIVHIRHLAWHSLSLPTLAKKSGCDVVYSFHDFYSLCPTVKLLNDRGEYCPDGVDKSDASASQELWPQNSMPSLSPGWLEFWRRRFEKSLLACDAFVTTSDSARATILRQMPAINSDRFFVIPHGRDFASFKNIAMPVEHGKPLRILVPGNISVAKGLNFIRDILSEDKLGLIEFHVLGKIDDSVGISHPRLILHGGYQREEFAAKAAKIGAHCGAIFSIWDETYCHTLTELWSVGLPAFVLNFENVAKRVSESGCGWVINHNDVSRAVDNIVKIGFDTAEQTKAGASLRRWQTGRGLGQSTRLMAAKYLNVYRQARGLSVAPLIAVVSPADKNLSKANASTEIRMWERTRKSIDREVIYVRMSPSALLANIADGEIDGAIIQRDVMPASLIDRFISVCADKRFNYIMELDDDLLSVPDDKDPTGKYGAYAPFLEKMLRHAALVTVSTKLLQEKIAHLNHKVTIVPNLLSNKLWAGSVVKGVKSAYRILYMGTKTHDQDLRFVLPIIESLRAELGEIKLSLIGITSDTGLPPWVDVIEIPNDAKSYSSFVPFLKENVEGIDIAIAPLMNTEFNRGKSWLKLLDYAALGLPVIASDVPSYSEFLKGQHVDGLYLVNNKATEWVKVLRRLLSERDMLTAQGDSLRKWVFNHHMLDGTLSDYDCLVKRGIVYSE